MMRGGRTTEPTSLCKRPDVSSRKNVALLTQRSHLNHAAVDLSNFSIKKEQATSGQEIGTVNKILLLNYLLSILHMIWYLFCFLDLKLLQCFLTLYSL